MAEETLRIRLIGDARQLTGELRRARAELDRLNRGGSLARREMRDMHRGTVQAAGGFNLLRSAIAGIGIGTLVQQFTRATIALEQINRVLEVSAGSAALGRDAFRFLRAEADRLGISFTESAAGFAKLSAAAEGTKLAGQGVRDAFIGIASAASVLGLSATETNRLLRAFEQIVSKGQLMAEELKLQIGDVLPGAVRIAAESLGMTTRQLFEEMKKGSIEGVRAVEAMTRAMREKFEVAAVKSVNTLRGQLNLLRNSLYDLVDALNRAGASSALAGLAATARRTIENIVTFMDTQFGYITDYLTVAGQQWGTIFESFSDVAGEAFQGVQLDGEDLKEFLIDLFIDFPDSARIAFLSIVALGDQAIIQLKDIWDGFATGVAIIWERIKGAAAQAAEFIKITFANALAAVVGDVVGTMTSIAKELQSIPLTQETGRLIASAAVSLDDYRISLEKTADSSGEAKAAMEANIATLETERRAREQTARDAVAASEEILNGLVAETKAKNQAAHAEIQRLTVGRQATLEANAMAEALLVQQDNAKLMAEASNVLADETEKLTKAEKKAKEEAEKHAFTLKSLQEDLTRLARTIEGEVQEAYEKQLDALVDERAQLLLNEEQYYRYQLAKEGIVGLRQDELAAIFNANEALRQEQEELEKTREAQERFVDSVAGAFDKLWSDMVSGVKSASEIVVDTIKSMLLSIIQTIIRNKIVIPIATAIAPGAAVAGTGAAGGGLGFGNIFSGFGNFLTGGTNNIMQGFSQLGGFLGTDLFNAGTTTSGFGGFLGSDIGTLGVGALAGVLGNELFGGYGGTGASIGSAIGTAILPGIGTVLGGLFGGFLGGLFGNDKPSNRAAFGSIDLSTLATTTSAMTGKKSPSEETLQVRDTYLQAISGFVQGLNQLGGAASGIVSLDIGQREGVQANFGQGLEQFGKDAEAALDQIFERILENTEGLSEPFKTLIQFAEGAEEKLQQIQALGALDEILNADPFEAYSQAVEAAGRSVWETAIQQRDALYDLTSAYDGSVSATQRLAEATAAGYQIILQVIAQIDQAAAAIEQTYSSAIEKITVDLLDNPAKYEYYRQQAEALAAGLDELTDPAAIQAAALEIERLAQAAYGTLDEEQRQEMGQEFIEFLQGVKEVSQEQLEEARQAAQREAEQMREAIQTALTEAANEFKSAAADMKQAAQTMQQAANTPVQVDVSGGAGEVGY